WAAPAMHEPGIAATSGRPLRGLRCPRSAFSTGAGREKGPGPRRTPARPQAVAFLVFEDVAHVVDALV
ncbi:MAG: hypothetical protein AVDCRST_MAG05-4482, partial [uncultured Rubrobacteraceae bacterium]